MGNRFYSRYGSLSFPGHCSILTGVSPILTNPKSGSFNLQTVPDMLDQKGVSWKIYGGWAAKYITSLSSNPNNLAGDTGAARFLADAKNHALPEVSYIFPTQGHSQHPTQDLRVGDSWYASLIQAVIDAGDWNNTMFMLTYDDWGGLADAQASPQLPGSAGLWSDGTVVSEGSRLPLVISGGAAVPGLHSDPADHASIPKFICDFAGAPYPNAATPGQSQPGVSVDWATVGALDGFVNYRQAPKLPGIVIAGAPRRFRSMVVGTAPPSGREVG